MHEIRCSLLTKTFGTGASAVTAVQEVTASFHSGTFYSIIGKSGSGKSTLLHMLSGILKPTAGIIWYDGLLMNIQD